MATEENKVDTENTAEEALEGVAPVALTYNITNQESWSAAVRQFFKGAFELAIVTVVLCLLLDGAGCIDLVKVIHGP